MINASESIVLKRTLNIPNNNLNYLSAILKVYCFKKEDKINKK